MKTRWFSLLSLVMGMILLLLPGGVWPTAAQSQPVVPLDQTPLDNATMLAAPLSLMGEIARVRATTTDAQNVEFVGHIGGGAIAVAVQGNYAYVGMGPRLTILDISDPASPTVAGKTSMLTNGVYGVAVAGGYAYVASGGLRVMDVSVPTLPTEIGFYDSPGFARGVVVVGDYAYVADGDDGLRIVDISTPTTPTEVGFYDTPGYAQDVTVAGDYAYVADRDDGGLRVIDISTPSNPTEVGFYDTPGYALDVAVAGDYAYVADGYTSGLRIVDISTPITPTEVGDFNGWGGTSGVAIAGSYAYISDSYALWVVDVTTPTNPTEVGLSHTPGRGLDLVVAGDYAYIADISGGLRVVDVSTPSNPTKVGFYKTSPGDARGVAVVGGYAYVADFDGGVQVVNISTPASPMEVGFYDTSGLADKVTVVGSYAYVADWWYLRILNINNPAVPTQAGFYDTAGVCQGVAISENYAYVADGDGGLRVVDVSTPSNPTEVGFYDTPGSARSVAVVGDYVYVADGDGGLRIMDVLTPTFPTEVGFYDTLGYAYDVIIAGDYAYVAASGGLRIVNVSTPSSPMEVGFYDTPGVARGVVVTESYAYIADGSGLRIVDVSTPSNPTEVGFYDTPGYAYDVTIAGDYAYVAASDGGLFILRYTGIETAYSVSGQVTDADSNPIAGATIWAGFPRSTSTDGNGNYTLTGLITGTYTFIPAKDGYTFTPVTRTVSVPPDVTGVDFTGIPLTVDIGFRPSPDGYEFSNASLLWSRYPLPPANSDYTIDDMRRMFGDAAVCHMDGIICNPKPSALKWNSDVNREMNGGHCDGFTTTSLRFFKDLDNLVDFQPGASNTYDLQLGKARRHIAYYWVLQVPNPVAAARNQALQNTPNQVLDQLRSAMSGGADDPTTLIVYNSDRTSGHSITPYAIEDQGGGVYWVQVYDNNHPDDANRHVAINTTNDTWSYNLGGSIGTWSGDANSHSLGAISISTYAQQPECPWCDGAWALNASQAGQTQTWLDGQGHLLITDSQGRQIGYLGDQYMNEVPGAFGSVLPGGLGISEEPIYYLPITDTYTILLDGQTLTQTETVAVTQFGPGYAVSVGDVYLGPGFQDHLSIVPDGTELVYQSEDGKEATLTLALDGDSESNQFQIGGADIGAGQVVTLTVDTVDGRLSFNNAQTSGGEYSLNIRRVSAAGGQWFVHVGVIISATDTHHAGYGAWDGSGPLTLTVDHGSDGTIDETLVLENQVKRIYLPLVLRNS